MDYIFYRLYLAYKGEIMWWPFSKKKANDGDAIYQASRVMDFIIIGITSPLWLSFLQVTGGTSLPFIIIVAFIVLVIRAICHRYNNKDRLELLRMKYADRAESSIIPSWFFYFLLPLLIIAIGLFVSMKFIYPILDSLRRPNETYKVNPE